MKDLYIINYCDKRCSPLRSITRLQTTDAYSLAKELSQYTSASFTSFSRFSEKDFDGYYKKRIRTEEWLYNSFIAIGGRPKGAHPLYFVLGESAYLHNWFENGLVTKLLLSDIHPDDVSFTYGDSMGKMDADDRMNPFNKQSLFDFVNQTAGNIVEFLNRLNAENRYIEVQLWNDAYLGTNR